MATALLHRDWRQFADAKAEVVSLRFLSLDSVPIDIFEWKNITTLDLSNNNLVKLPDDVIKLRHVKTLLIAGNKLASFPGSFQKMTSLETLSVSDNLLTSDVVDEAKLEKLSHLSVLYLAKNKLTRVPACLFKMNKLVKVSLADNAISELPIGIDKLMNLKSLSLSGNKITNHQQWSLVAANVSISRNAMTGGGELGVLSQIRKHCNILTTTYIPTDEEVRVPTSVPVSPTQDAALEEIAPKKSAAILKATSLPSISVSRESSFGSGDKTPVPQRAFKPVSMDGVFSTAPTSPTSQRMMLNSKLSVVISGSDLDEPIGEPPSDIVLPPNVSKMPCGKCQKPILNEQYIQASEKPWHKLCFTCTLCQKQLEVSDYFSIQDASGIEDRLHAFNLTLSNALLFDSACYYKLLGLVCSKCGDVVSMGFFESHDGKYHEECFVCSECGRVLHDFEEDDICIDPVKGILCISCCP